MADFNLAEYRTIEHALLQGALEYRNVIGSRPTKTAMQRAMLRLAGDALMYANYLKDRGLA